MAMYLFGEGELSLDVVEDVTDKMISVLYDSLPEGTRSVEVMESVLKHTKEKIRTCEITKPSQT